MGSCVHETRREVHLGEKVVNSLEKGLISPASSIFVFRNYLVAKGFLLSHTWGYIKTKVETIYRCFVSYNVSVLVGLLMIISLGSSGKVLQLFFFYFFFFAIQLHWCLSFLYIFGNSAFFLCLNWTLNLMATQKCIDRNGTKCCQMGWHFTIWETDHYTEKNWTQHALT